MFTVYSVVLVVHLLQVCRVHLSHKTAGILSIVIDVGVVISGVLAIYSSDMIESRAVTTIVFFVAVYPCLHHYFCLWLF